jgi:hypothetical protein
MARCGRDAVRARGPLSPRGAGLTARACCPQWHKVLIIDRCGRDSALFEVRTLTRVPIPAASPPTDPP